MTAPRTGGLLRTWTATVTAAELSGFAVPLVVGAVTARAATPLAAPALLLAGAGEGAVLGWGQVRVLRRVVPDLGRVRWIGHTAAGVTTSYLVWLLPWLTVSWWNRWPPIASSALAVLLGIVLLAAPGLAQWPLLRGRLPRAWRWIVVTALAWLAGLGVLLGIAAPLWRPDEPLGGVLLVGVLAAILMAVTAAVVSGLGLVHLLGSRRDPGPRGRPPSPSSSDRGSNGTGPLRAPDESPGGRCGQGEEPSW